MRPIFSFKSGFPEAIELCVTQKIVDGHGFFSGLLDDGQADESVRKGDFEVFLVVGDDKNAFNKMRIVKYDEMKYYVSSNILDRDGYTRGKCMETESAPSARPEATLIIYQDGRSLMEIDHVKDYCDIDAKISQKVVGDTLFLDYYDTGNVTECLCTFQTHKIIIDLDKTGAKYVKFGSVVYRIVGVTYSKVPNWEL